MPFWAAADDCIPGGQQLANRPRVHPQIDDWVGPVSPGKRSCWVSLSVAGEAEAGSAGLDGAPGQVVLHQTVDCLSLSRRRGRRSWFGWRPQESGEGLSGGRMWVQWKKSAPKGIRTPVAGLKGQCPGPLDDGGIKHRQDSTMSKGRVKVRAVGCYTTQCPIHRARKAA